MTASAEPAKKKRRGFFTWLEGAISRLSTRNNFWHRVCSFIWLPYAFRSGIRMKRIDGDTFTAVLPFRRFNRNWYNAMAGASLLANSEIAGGMFVFSKVGRDNTVVCKELTYRFLRPCFGPAVYQVIPKGDIDALAATDAEFNIDIQLNVYQQLRAPGERGKRVGRVKATFHVTPKAHHHDKAQRDKQRAARGNAADGEQCHAPSSTN
ncbi:MAG: hypothetical protein AAFX05_06620 [Planctomycetota bacterium]